MEWLEEMWLKEVEVGIRLDLQSFSHGVYQLVEMSELGVVLGMEGGRTVFFPWWRIGSISEPQHG